MKNTGDTELHENRGGHRFVGDSNYKLKANSKVLVLRIVHYRPVYFLCTFCD